MSGEKIVKRLGSQRERKKAHDSLAEVGFRKAEYIKWKSKLKDLEDTLAFERAKQKRANDFLLEIEDQLGLVEEEIDSDPLPEGAQPKQRIVKRDGLRLRMVQLQAALNAQKQSSQSALDAVNEAERKLFEADRNLHQYVDNIHDAHAVLTFQTDMDKERAERLVKLEVKRAKLWENEQKLAIDARAAQVQELTRLATQQISVAKSSHSKAVERSRDANAHTKETTFMLKEAEDQHQQHRADAVIELKSNISKVRTELATNCERISSKIAKAQQHLEDEKDSMLSKGLNPYVEFRKKNFQEEASDREKYLRDAVAKNKEELSERLMFEEQLRMNEELERLKAKSFERAFRDSQGRQSQEKKNKLHISSITTGAKEILDPTGKLPRVNPSQVTEIPDLSFGLGKSARISAGAMQRVTEKVSNGLKVHVDDFGEYNHLVNGHLVPEEREQAGKGTKKREESDIIVGTVNQSHSDLREEKSGSSNATFGDKLEAEENGKFQLRGEQNTQFKSFASLNGPMPGLSKAAVILNLADPSEKDVLLKLAEEEACGSLKDSLGPSEIKSPKYKAVQLSKFEDDSLLRAKERQKIRVEQGTAQVAGGKLFMGTSYVSKPSEIVFKDFQVGKKYKKQVVLTNASYTFNSFKLLNLTDDVVDFFTLSYDKPGRMSAGMSCTIDVVFVPQTNVDIFSSIRLQTETGPVEIPLQCLIKRCAARVTGVCIDFGSVIVGQESTQMMHVKNSQAIGTDYVIERLGNTFDCDFAESNHLGGSTCRGSSQRTLYQIDVWEVEEDDKHDNNEPAKNEIELDGRVRRTMTEVYRRKFKHHPHPLSFRLPEGFVDGYSEASSMVTCAPLHPGTVEEKFLVRFVNVKDADHTHDENGQLVTREQVVTVRVRGEQLPIYVDDEIIDLKCTLYGRIYRKRLEIRNQGAISYRVNAIVPKRWGKFVEVNPPMIIVQSKSSQAVNIKFTPSSEILSTISYFMMPYGAFQDAALAKIPIKFQVVNQELPLYFILRSQMCLSSLKFSSFELNFGNIYTNQQSTIQVKVQNLSMQPQKVAFVKVRKEITVQPNEGFAVLLPNEEISFHISFSPVAAIDYNFDLVLMSSLSDTYEFKVCAKGIDCPLSFSSTTLRMRSTGPGERVLESVVVRNISKKSQCFEIMCPSNLYSWVKVSPTVVEMAAGEGRRVEFEYLPPADALKIDPMEWKEEIQKRLRTHQQDGQLGAKQAAYVEPFEEWEEHCGWICGRGIFGELQWVKPGAGNKRLVVDNANTPEGCIGANGDKGADDSAVVFEDVPDEQWGVSGKWRFPIFLRPRGKNSLIGRAVADDQLFTDIVQSTTQNGGTTIADSPMPLFFLNLETVVSLPQMEADEKVIDFGQVAVGTRHLKSFRVTNHAFASVMLDSFGLNAVGPFTLITPMSKPISGGAVKTFLIECLPLRPGLNVEVLELSPSKSGGGHRLRIALRAEGLMPTIALEGVAAPPPNWNTRHGILDFGNIVAGDTTTNKFSVVNKSLFAVEINISRSIGNALSPYETALMLDRTAEGLPIFTLRPEQAMVEPGKTQEVEVTFRPDRGKFDAFRDDLVVRVGATDEFLRVGVVGRAWSRQVFLTTAAAVEEPFITNKHSNPSAFVEDVMVAIPKSQVKKLALEIGSTLRVEAPSVPAITLEFPDPFDDQADPATYFEIDQSAGFVKPTKGPSPPNPVVMVGKSRQQKKTVMVRCAKINDGRGSVGNVSFEIVLGQRAKDSGIWSVSVEKGSVNSGGEVAVNFLCTLPKPRGIGGMAVGSWQSFTAEVITKGGWAPQGETDDVKMPIVLKAYVSL